MKNKVIGVLLSIILIVVMGAIAFAGLMNHRNSESSVKLNYEEAYGISGNQYTVIFNNELNNKRLVAIRVNHIKDVINSFIMTYIMITHLHSLYLFVATSLR